MPIPLRIAQVFSAVAMTAIIVFLPGTWDFSRWAGFVIAVPAMLLLLTAQGQLGSSFSITPQARHLVTGGLYSKIRNPIYFFGSFVILGFFLAIHKSKFLLILVIIMPVQIVRARAEAKVLEERFGDEYRNYRRNTWF